MSAPSTWSSNRNRKHAWLRPIQRFHQRTPGVNKIPLRSLAIISLLVLINILVWIAVAIVLRFYPALGANAVLAWSLGLRHAFDADHISAIDLMTRRLLATAAISSRFDSFSTIGGIIGTSVSAAFLIVLGLMNAYILYKLIKQMQKVLNLPEGQEDEIWKIEGGFDTSSEIALLGISSIEAAKGTDFWVILIFPILFTAGMCLLDTADGALMLALYVQPAANFLPQKPDTEPLMTEANEAGNCDGEGQQKNHRDPIAFLYYSIVLTCLTVVVAIVIGIIQLLSLVLNVASPTGKFWDGVETAGEYYDAIGGGIAGCFVAVGVLSVFAYKPWRRWIAQRHGKTILPECDNDYPVCSNCQKAGTECDKATVRQESSGQQNEYTRALEERVAYLESQLETRPMANAASSSVTHPVAALLSPQTQETAPAGSTAGVDHNAVGELVGFLALSSSEAPAYVGSSSGLSLAANLGEMVQATVWNQVLAPSRGQQSSSPGANGQSTANGSSGLPPQPSSARNTPRPRTLRMEELLAKGTEPPNDEMGSRILDAYLTRLHVRYPFLDRLDLWRLHEARWRLARTKREDLSQSERFGIFKLYLVYAIGATTISLSEKYTYVPPERFYITALQQVPAMCETRSVENIEAMTLLVVYHLRSASSQGVWYMVGLAMRTAIDLGLHRKANEINLDIVTAQMRRRLFWTVYYLERVVSMSLGRPFSIADRHIDLPLPLDIDDDVRDPAMVTTTSPPSDAITTLTFSIYLIQLRRIDSKIQHKIYRADRPLHLLRSKMDRLFLELEEWKDSAFIRFSGRDLDYPILHYNRALRLLIQPFLPSLTLTDPYYHICLRAAGNICQTHKRLHQTLEYGHSFLAVQTVFMAGITLLYALWTHSTEIWSVQISNDIRACSTVLFVMGERAAWVKKYRDAFELLVNAAMEKLESNDDPARKVGMAELMTAQTAMAGAPGPFKHHHSVHTEDGRTSAVPDLGQQQGPLPVDPESQDHGVRMAFQLAPWIDLEEDSPFWMPDFETLESLSGNLWSGGDPAPFDPL
ncbi:hypothetical protein FE257_013072 [Aspergillus nanangensis]|uniref:Xylanolytic transcriptional activator regulatory domain-containing protein n=1 Tax=Aspergillus nanangensis TaxID=2582783 RepID=A0AAD4CF43_ASPNN|nr:hypothetical protein FE257_013072 [Aspergillus nanangensis]